MIGKKSVLGIIPARGASKGVPRKNLKELCGKPLIAWTIEEAKKSAYIDTLVLSSEDDEIRKKAAELGCDVPFIRPHELALDDTPGIEPILHAISMLPNYDLVVMLQPTSPLRTAQDIDECIEAYMEGEYDTCVSVSEVDKTPYWMYELNEDQKLLPILGERVVLKRQDAPVIYELNGAVYVSSKESLIEKKSFLTDNTVGYIMQKNRSYDIDTELDFKICELLIRLENQT